MATILIVDDEVNGRRPLATLLKCEGYAIVEACDGLEGLHRLGESGADLVLLDLTMPNMDGMTMLQAIRKKDEWAKLPIFLLTGEHNPELLRKVAMIGIQEFIYKGDTSFSKMLELIKRHLGEHRNPKRRGRRPKNPSNNDRLLIRVTGDDYADEEAAMPIFRELFKSLNDYHIADGGRGLIIDGWDFFVPAEAEVGVL